MTAQLPADLKALMLSLPGFQSFAAGINDECAIVLKIDPSLADEWRGDLQVGYRAECGFYPGGAVMRLVFTIYDQPYEPYVFDTFLNPGREEDADLLQRLSRQRMIAIHLFDLNCDYLYSKQIKHRDPAKFELSSLVGQARRHNAQLSRPDYATALAQMKHDRPM